MSASEAMASDRLEALLAGDAPRTPDEARRAHVLAQLRAASLAAPDVLRSRVSAAAPSRRRTFAPRPSRRLLFVVLPATLAVAVTAAIVHGLTNGGSGPRAANTIAAVAAAPTSGATQRRKTPGLSSGGAATGGVHSPLAPDALGAPEGTLAPTGGTGRLQHTDASLQVRVPDVEHLSSATRAATRIATSLGGYAQSVRFETPRGGSGTASIELRVPAENVQRALSQLAGLGTLVSQNVSVQDLEHALQIESQQVAQLRRRVAALHVALADPALPDAQRVLLQIRLAEAKRALAQRLQARKGTVVAGTTARISLVLGTERSVVAPVHHEGRAGRMLHSALGFLSLEGVVALVALIVISPLALLAALAWGLVRARRRRDESRLLVA